MWKFSKNKILSVSVCVLLAILTIETDYSFIGWYRDGDKMTYLNNEGLRYANTWRESDGMKFYLGADGYVVYNKCFEYNGHIYCVDKNGAKITNRFVDVTSDMILDDIITPGKFYFGENGAAFQKDDTNFSKIINGKKFAFDEEGHLITDCWLDKDGELVDVGDGILENGFYHVKSDGTLSQNEWYFFSGDAGAEEEFVRSNLIAESFDEMDSLWMYFGSNAAKYKSPDSGFKKLTYNGKTYYFDENGIMIEGFQANKYEIDTNQQSNPTLKEKIRVFDKYDGSLLKKRWIYDTTPETFDYDSYLSGDGYWFYLDDSGYLVTNKIKTIGSKKYSFDGLGRLRKGFILVDGKTFMGAEYKSEDLTRDDFLYSIDEGGSLYGSDLLDIHYFDESEDTREGEMRTGIVNIELSDGKYDFYFRPSGVAFGNKNELKKYKNVFYKNGLKLKPWEDTKYGVVKVSDDEYRVVNQNGSIVTGKKRLIKDDFDNYMVVLNDRLAAYIVEPQRKVQLRWKTFNGITGYYYYDMDLEKKAYTTLAVESGTLCPTENQLDDIPKDLRINFR